VPRRMLRIIGWLTACCLVALFASGCGSDASRESVKAKGKDKTSTNTKKKASSKSSEAGAKHGTVAAVTSTSTTTTAKPPAGPPPPGPPTKPGVTAGTGAWTGGGPYPVIVGVVGQFSGFESDANKAALDVLVAWAQSTNDRGGVNGHPVYLLAGDDGGDAGQSVQLARYLVEEQHAIVLSSIGSHTAIADYARSKGVPVVGVRQTGGAWNANPLLFPPSSGPGGLGWGAARLMKQAGVTKVAGMWCAETATCKDGVDRWSGFTGGEGLQVVSQAGFSNGAPDFTAECRQMSNAGAQAVYVVGDPAAIARLAKSCARQGFRPIWVTPSAMDAMATVPELDNAIAVSGGLPWFLRSGTPAVQDYADALRRFAPERLTTGHTDQGAAWLAGKLIERAGARVSAVPTSQELLDGLHALRGDTIFGLAPGGLARTFLRGQPTPETYCVVPTRLQGGAWTAPQGLTPVCR
jgi:branched-chain amino acid transport system substrate-binding protein